MYTNSFIRLRKLFGASTLLGLCTMLSTAYGQGPLPQLLNYQGVLSDAFRTAVPDNSYSLSFRIYTVETGGLPLWEETNAIATIDGVFETTLGLNTPLTIPFDEPYWLELELSGEPAMTPRIPFVSTPYAMNAANAINAGMANELAPTAPDVVHTLNGLDGRLNIVGTGLTTVTESGSTITVAVPNLLPENAVDGQTIRWNQGLAAWETSTPIVNTTARLNGTGSATSPLDIAQMGAADGQPLVWNDAAGAWEPGEAGVRVNPPLRGDGSTGQPIGFIDGNASGQVLYWNGTDWVQSEPTNATNGDILRWDDAANSWSPGEEQVVSIEEITGDGTTGNPLRLANQGAANGQVLRWDDVADAWRPGVSVELSSPPLTGTGDTDDPLRLADGNSAGQILYWNGNVWVHSEPIPVSDGWVMRWNAASGIWEPQIIEVTDVAPLPTGSIWHGDANNVAQELPIGTANQVLIVDPVNALPTWSSSLSIDSMYSRTLNVAGGTTLNADLTVSADTRLTGNLAVDGTTELNGTVVAGDSVSFNGPARFAQFPKIGT